MEHLTEDMIKSDNYHSKPTKGSRTFVCAVDGSEGSNLAFRMMMDMRKRLDHVCLFHTYSLEKEKILPQCFRKDELRSYYENELIHTYHLPVGKFSFDWTDRKGHTVNQILVELLNEYKGIRNPMTPTRQIPDFFFCGFSGRKKSPSFHELNSNNDDGKDEKESKESKEGKESYDTICLGSTAEFASRNVHIPVIIAKKSIKNQSEQRCFIVGVDGTSLSKRGFHLLLQLVNPYDRLKLIYIFSPEQIQDRDELQKNDAINQDIFLDYENDILTFSPNVEYTTETLICPENSSISHTICDYAHDHNADFISISPRANGGLSSVSEQIIYLSPCSVILTKN
mmetsp:Transcript_3585/g.3543  ORF Transcript_3585/g.3543 Transcript_3585/m.3543 type:complete len:340 (+) Transcript_3585:80-1099(+)